MASGGVTARNTRQGFRSEYIVKYIFTAFGTAVDVSAENDLGLDLLCNLTTFEGKLIIHKSAFGIQVKSKGTPFSYKGKQATTWLSKLEFPLLLVEVDKKKSRIKVFSTWNVNSYVLGFHTDDENAYPDNIQFVTSKTNQLQPPDCATGTIPVGKPILDFHFSEIDNETQCELFHNILSEWLSIDNYNYILRRAGVSRTYGYIKWNTNQIPSIDHLWDKRYVYSQFHNKNINKLLIHALTVQGTYNRDNSAGGTIEPFKTTFNDIRYFVNKYLEAEKEQFEIDLFKDPI